MVSARKGEIAAELVLEDVVKSYEISLHPDSISTENVIEAMGPNGLMPSFLNFERYDSKGLGETASGDPIVIAGVASLHYRREDKKDKIIEFDKDIMVVGQNDRLLSPESLIFARQMYKVAERKGLDLLLIANTEGGDAMDHAAFMGQSYQVSENIMTLLNLKTRIASLVLRKGGSGGALSNQVADVALMMEYANYHVISPPHCVSILWSRKPDKTLADALKLMKGSPRYLKEAGIIDEIIPEYPGGSHLEAPIDGRPGYTVTLENIDSVLGDVFQQFHYDKTRPDALRLARLKKAREGYATRIRSKVETIRKLVPGLDRQTKMKQIADMTLSDLERRMKDREGSLVINLNYQRIHDLITQLADEKERIAKAQSSLQGEELQEELRRIRASASIIQCGDYIQGNRPGHFYEFDKAALDAAMNAYTLGRITFVEAMRLRADILKNPLGKRECRANFSPEEFAANFYSCPECGSGLPMSARDMIHMLIDSSSNVFNFEELNHHVSVNNFEPTIYHTPEYLEKIEGLQAKLKYTEKIKKGRRKQKLDETSTYSALMTGVGKINGMPTMICAMDFSFVGGTIGMVEPRKFYEAADFAINNKLPVVMMTYSGGARMQENQFALQAMKSMNATVQYLRDNGIFYGVVLMGDTFGGTPASFAAQGVVTLAERGMRYGFTGPIVLQRALSERIDNPFHVEERMRRMEHMMMPEVLSNVYIAPGRPLIDFVGGRGELKNELSKYLASWYGRPFKPMEKNLT